jgi:small subunit ribosomal protein S6
LSEKDISLRSIFDKQKFILRLFMKHYEVTFIVDPVLSGDEIKSTAKTYSDMLVTEGCKIIHVDELGLKQLAYPINKRSSGIYYCVEFSTETGEIIAKLELALRRDERIMRFLTIGLDKYGIKYNEDKRNGVIRKYEAKTKKKDSGDRKFAGKPAGVSAAPKAAVAAAPIAKAKSEEE